MAVGGSRARTGAGSSICAGRCGCAYVLCVILSSANPPHGLFVSARGKASRLFSRHPSPLFCLDFGCFEGFLGFWARRPHVCECVREREVERARVCVCVVSESVSLMQSSSGGALDPGELQLNSGHSQPSPQHERRTARKGQSKAPSREGNTWACLQPLPLPAVVPLQSATQNSPPMILDEPREVSVQGKTSSAVRSTAEASSD